MTYLNLQKYGRIFLDHCRIARVYPSFVFLLLRGYIDLWVHSFVSILDLQNILYHLIKFRSLNIALPGIAAEGKNILANCGDPRHLRMKHDATYMSDSNASKTQPCPPLLPTSTEYSRHWCGWTSAFSYRMQKRFAIDIYTKSNCKKPYAFHDHPGAPVLPTVCPTTVLASRPVK